MTQPAKPSHVESVKETSRHLRGTIQDTLASDAPKFSEDEYNLLKFHGSYQGYDRDSATERKKQGVDKEWQFMVRARIPAGKLTARQYLEMDALADRRANATVRVTTRQGIQFHGIVKDNLKGSIADINEALLTTLAACGDVVRNVTASPVPLKTAVHRRLLDDARLLSDELLPRTRAYHEIWLDGERVSTTEAEIEPLYGATYLPRKFKIGVGVPEDNSVDILTNDLGIVALFDGDDLVGYNFAVGGGFGMTHNKAQTYPRMASFVAFVEPDDLLAATQAVIAVQRDHGDRSNRKHARLKYTIDEHGLDWFKAELDRYMGKELEQPRAMPPFRVKDHMGWHEQGDGRWYLGLPIPSGRIQDTETVKLRTALRTLVERWQPEIILMPTQDILLHEIEEADIPEIEAHLRSHGVALASDVLPVLRWSMACPALPTCGLALTEAERVRDPMVESIAKVMARHGLEREVLSIRITGCPNGCARPYAGDIGLVGRMPGFYALYIGGDFEGTRLNFRLLDRVAEAKIPETLEPMFAAFARDRQANEGFGDFCNRLGPDRLTELVTVPLAEAS
ncbi:MAG TPA: NADPH-dependent assimilatory sulfite reductase hemoprotein subunit [Arenibaculum sp.]|nr:NADPH-dependent assimilatory sulfite reductase hemoprotein subunit [Arenibaculum sp.]